MNPHILFVMKLLDNPKQFTKEQVYANRETASDANVAYAIYVILAAYNADTSVYGDYEDANFYLNKYFEVTGKDRKLYLDQIEADKQ